MIITLAFIVLLEVLGLTTPFIGNCWGHTIFKCCQYVLDDTTICVVKLTSIYFAKNYHQKLLGPNFFFFNFVMLPN
jgi:hypothetical protein